MIICDETFEGPVTLDAPGVPTGRPGVYVIVCECAQDGKHRMVDCSETKALGSTLGNPASQQSWREAYDGQLLAFVWSPEKAGQQDVRSALVQRIRERYHPWCNR